MNYEKFCEIKLCERKKMVMPYYDTIKLIIKKISCKINVV